MSIKSSFFALIQLVLLNLILCKYLGTSSLSYSIWSIILLTILLFINKVLYYIRNPFYTLKILFVIL